MRLRDKGKLFDLKLFYSVPPALKRALPVKTLPRLTS